MVPARLAPSVLPVSVAFFLAFAVGCGKGDDKATATSAAASASAAPASATAVSASASAAPAASAATGKPAAAGAASYAGDFESKAGTLYLPDRKEFQGVKKVDFESKAALGAGKIEIAVDAQGTVSGTVSGALGDLTIAGRSEAGRITATLKPTTGTDGFYGTLLAEPSPSGELVGTLSASGARSNVLREAELKLAKK
jgi:hypothetical protein